VLTHCGTLATCNSPNDSRLTSAWSLAAKVVLILRTRYAFVVFWRASFECRNIEDMLLLISCLRPRILSWKAKFRKRGAAKSSNHLLISGRTPDSQIRMQAPPFALCSFTR